jgi:hypothetical protein
MSNLTFQIIDSAALVLGVLEIFVVSRIAGGILHTLEGRLAQVASRLEAPVKKAYEAATSHVESAVHETCSFCKRIVARYERLENDVVRCVNCKAEGK